MPKNTIASPLIEMYQLLMAHYGPTHWWPGDTDFEVAIGAILTQNTAWTNVEKAIDNLKREDLLDPVRLLNAPLEHLETALRPSGYYRQKAERLRIFCDYLQSRYRGRIANMRKKPTDLLRAELLALKGIGPETADDILLYACHKIIFVVDAYTRRILFRHGMAPETLGYADLQALFHDDLPADLNLFQEFHGLIVYTGKDFCRTKPRCTDCPLRNFAGGCRIPEGRKAVLKKGLR